MNRRHTLITTCIIGGLCSVPLVVWGQLSIRELQTEIQLTSNKIEELEQEIAKDEANLNRLAGEKQTLASTINQLNASERNLNGAIASTEQDIQTTNQLIDQLSEEISVLDQFIQDNHQVIAQTLREIHKQADTGVWEALLTYGTFSEFLAGTTMLTRRTELLQNRLDALYRNKESLRLNNNTQRQARFDLREQQESLQDRKALVYYNRQNKQALLQETKNQESNFQTSLADKQQALREFELRMQAIESELEIAIDESRVQQKLVGLFSWPFASWYPITQFFGNTSYAITSGTYNGRGHSGVDFGTPLGTPILAVMDGVVMGAGDTGEYGAMVNGVYRPCTSYGQWIVLDHMNGLSTRYGHLSLIKVEAGQEVRRGQVIGYSGNTGVSTGPHLHLSVAATQGVQIRRLGDVMATTACADAPAPITAANAYKDPFDYLPRPEFELGEVSLGESSGEVRRLQMMLKHERIFPIEVSANGVYGPTTARAVLEWQKKYRVDNPAVLDAEAGEVFDERSIDRYKSLF